MRNFFFRNWNFGFSLGIHLVPKLEPVPLFEAQTVSKTELKFLLRREKSGSAFFFFFFSNFNQKNPQIKLTVQSRFLIVVLEDLLSYKILNSLLISDSLPLCLSFQLHLCILISGGAFNPSVSPFIALSQSASLCWSAPARGGGRLLSDHDPHLSFSTYLLQYLWDYFLHIFYSNFTLTFLNFLCCQVFDQHQKFGAFANILNQRCQECTWLYVNKTIKE